MIALTCDLHKPYPTQTSLSANYQLPISRENHSCVCLLYVIVARLLHIFTTLLLWSLLAHAAPKYYGKPSGKREKPFKKSSQTPTAAPARGLPKPTDDQQRRITEYAARCSRDGARLIQPRVPRGRYGQAATDPHAELERRTPGDARERNRPPKGRWVCTLCNKAQHRQNFVKHCHDGQ